MAEISITRTLSGAMAPPHIAEPLQKDTPPPADDARSDNQSFAAVSDISLEKQEKSSEDADQYPPLPTLVLLLVGVALSIFLVSLDLTIVATAIPEISKQFHDLTQVGWIGSAFFLTIAAFQSTWGKAYKYFNLKWTFMLAIAIFELGSLICGVAPSITALIVGRAIQGVGGAGVASGAYTIIGVSAPPSSRAAFTGVLGMAYGIASAIGPLLGGVFVSKLSWRWCFYINLPVGAVSLLVILFFFHTPDAVKPVKAPFKEKVLQMDLLGSALIMAAVVCYLLALQWGGVEAKWSNSKVVGLLVGFALLVCLFIANEWYQGDRAMVPFRLLRNRIVAVAFLFNGIFSAAFFIILFIIPLYFQAVDSVSAAQSGVRNLPFVLSISVFSIISGLVISMSGYYIIVMILGAVISAVGSGLIYTLGIGSPSSAWIGYQVLAGIGIGLALQTPVISGQAVVAPEDLSSVTAMVLYSQTIMGSFAVSAAQTALNNVLLKSAAKYVPSVSPASILANGATGLREAFPADVIPGILRAYLDGIRTAYIIAIAAAAAAVVISVFGSWKKLPGIGAAAAI